MPVRRLKEAPEAVDYVIEQVVQHDVVLDDSWTLADILVVASDGVKAIVLLELGEVTVDLADELFRKGSVTSGKPSQALQPRVQVLAAFFTTHALIIILNNLNERTHHL